MADVELEIHLDRPSTDISVEYIEVTEDHSPSTDVVVDCVDEIHMRNNTSVILTSAPTR